MDPVVAALTGALIGASGPLLAAWFQQRADTSRKRLELAVQLAQRDFDFHLQQARPGEAVLPLIAYLTYHLELLEALSSGPADAELVRRLEERQKALLKALPIR